MISALPSRVINYKVSAVSPTDELITIGQILSEVGDYACTIIDREHLSVTRKCAARLKKLSENLLQEAASNRRKTCIRYRTATLNRRFCQQ